MTAEATSEPAAPPTFAIDMAIMNAQTSPCAKSKRGAVAFVEHALIRDGAQRGPVVILGQGFNGPPEDRLGCLGNDACRAMCSQLCTHAEVRALRGMALATQAAGVDRSKTPIDLVHVKIDGSGKLVAGGPPSCWPCANVVAEEGIAAVWLYEDMHEGPRWVRWLGTLFYESTLRRQPKHPHYMARNGIEQPCLWCRAQDGAKRDQRGFWRCVRCMEPGQ